MELCSNRMQTGLCTRRDMLQGLSCGFGMLGFSQLSFGQGLLDGSNPLAPRATHHQATAKRVIFLFMEGAPSHVDTFDYKPELSRLDGQRGNRNRRLLGSPFKFEKHGGTRIVCVCSMACTLIFRLMPRPKCKCIPVPPSLYDRPWDLGLCTAWVLRMKTYRALLR